MDEKKLYRVHLTLKSPLVTALKGDTIWGHVAWGIANHEGDEGVTSFLSDCKGENPAFVVSSAFPRGFVCKRIPEVQERKSNLSLDDYAGIKKAKKLKYALASDYFADCPKHGESAENPFENNIVTHNTICRFTNTVEDGGLYAVNELWAKQNDFDLYVLSSYSKERILTLLNWAFENGFGADSSTGKGNIAVVEKSDIEVVNPKCKGKTYMALAPFVVPDYTAISDLKADIFIRSGKIGGAFVSELSPWKKTCVLYDEGAVFNSETQIDFIGSLLENVHSDSRICQSGFAPVIPIA